MTRAEKIINLLRQSSLLVYYFQGYMPGYPEKIARFSNGFPMTYCNVFARDFMDSEVVMTGTGGFIGGEGSLWPNGFNLDFSVMRPGYSKFDIIINTTCDPALKNTIKAANDGLIKELNAKEAQQAANDGIVVWCATYDHEAIVSPNFVLNEKGLCSKINSYSAKYGPIVGQAGSYNGRAFVSDQRIWGDRWHEVRYFVFPEKE